MAFQDTQRQSLLMSPPENFHKTSGATHRAMASPVAYQVREDSFCTPYAPSTACLPVPQALPPSPISPNTTFIDESRPCIDPRNSEQDPQLFPGYESGVQGPLFPNILKPSDDVQPVDNRADSKIPKEGVPMVSCMWEVVKEQNAKPGTKPSILVDMERRADAMRRRREDLRAPLAPKRTGVEKRIRKPEFPPEQRRSPQPEQPRIQRVRRTPKERVYDTFEIETSPTLAQTPPQKRATREDTDWESIPDYCPPDSALGDVSANPKNVFVIEWKSSPLDLSTDPNRNLLHPGELHLAQTLRLTCATYLCSKRRIFQARVDCRKRGKEFRKTDAQQACKIDVNKASRLHSAFSKKGLFENKWSDRFV